MLPRRVERRLGIAVEHIAAGGIDIGEIRSQRPSLQVDETVGGDHQIEKAGDGGDEDGECHQPDALAREPGSASQYLKRLFHCGSRWDGGAVH